MNTAPATSQTSLSLLESGKKQAWTVLSETVAAPSDMEDLFDNAFSLIEYYIESENFMAPAQLGEALEFAFGKVEAANHTHNAASPGRRADISEKNHLIFSAIARALGVPAHLTFASTH